MAGITSDCVKQGQLTSQIMILKESLMNLSEGVAKLEEQLKPVLRPEDSVPSEVGEKEPVMVDRARQVLACTDLVRLSARQIGRICTRLEL